MKRAILIRFGKKPVDEARRRQQQRPRGHAAIGAVAALAAVAIAGPRTQPPPPPPAPAVVRVTAPAPIPAPAALTPAPAPAPAGPRAEAVPAAIEFRPLKVGAVSPAQLFTIRNSSAEPLKIGHVIASDERFLITNGCGGMLEAHSSCSVAVVFAPSKPGDQRARIAVETGDGTIAIPLRGSARPADSPRLDPVPVIVPMVTDGDATVANDAAIREAHAQLRDIKRVSLRGTADPPELMTQLSQLLERNGLTVVEGADVTIDFHGTLDHVRLGRRHRAGEATITSNGRPVLHYVLASEDYRVGDNPAEAFSRVLTRVFRAEP